MSCIKDTVAFNLLREASNADTAKVLIDNYKLDTDKVPFQKASNGKESKLFKALEGELSRKETMKVMLQIRTTQYKNKMGDWEANPKEYTGELDSNNEPTLSSALNSINEEMSTIDTEYIEEPGMTVSGLTEAELEETVLWGESKVLNSIYNANISEVELLTAMKDELSYLQSVLRTSLPHVKGEVLKERTESLRVVDSLLTDEGFRSYSEILQARLKSSGFTSTRYTSEEKKAIKRGKKIREGITPLTHSQEGAIYENSSYEAMDLLRRLENQYIVDPLVEEIWDDRKKLSIPLSDSTTFLFKSFLMNIPAFSLTVDENGKEGRIPLRNVVYQAATFDSKAVFNRVIESLADFEGTMSESIKFMEDSGNPILVGVAEKLSNLENPRYNQMRSAFKAIRDIQRHNIITVKRFTIKKFEDGEQTTTHEYRNMATNANSMRREALADAQSNQIGEYDSGKGILQIKNDIYTLDKDKLKEGYEKILDLNRGWIKLIEKTKGEYSRRGDKVNYRNLSIEYMSLNSDTIIKLLNDVGFNLSGKEYEDLLKRPYIYLGSSYDKYLNKVNINPMIYLMGSTKGSNFIASMYSKYSSIDDSSIYTNNTNPLEDRTVKNILEELKKQSDDNIITTFMDSSNNQVTDKGLPHFLSQLFKSFKSGNTEVIGKYLKADYSSGSRVLKMIKSGNTYVRDNILLGMTEALSSSNKSSFQRQDGTEEEKFFMELMEFVNNGKGKDNVDFMSFTPLVFSDKKRNIAVEWPKIMFDPNKDVIRTYDKETGLTDITEINSHSFRTAVSGIINGEIARILRIEELKERIESQKGKTKEEVEDWVEVNEIDRNWLKNGNRFYLFPSLNPLLEANEDQEFSLRSPEFLNLAISEVVADISQEFNNNMQKAKEIEGEYNSITKVIHSNYLDKHKSPESKVLGRLVLDYTINQVIGTAEVAQLLVDPAQLDKSKGDTKIPVMEIWRDWFKRMAGVVGTGIEGSFEFREKVNGENKLVDYANIDYLFLEDAQTNRYQKEYTKALSKAMGDAYSRVEVTDAQEYTTLKEHIVDLYSNGKLADEKYNSINAKIIQAYKEGNDVELTKEELVTIIPRKPMYYGAEFNPTSKSMDVTYVKSSSFPLIKQLTEGFELDSLRKKMESIERDNLITKDGKEREGDRTTVRVAFVSAAKIGVKNVNDIYVKDKDGKVIGLDPEKIKNIKATRRSRKGMKTQQEEGGNHEYEALTVSQMNALIVAGILDLEGFRGNKTGRQLKDEKENIRKELMQMGKEELFEELGIVNDKFTSIEKLRDFLKDNIESTKITKNELQSLKLVKGALALPLDFTYFSGKIMSTINSAINKKILRPRVRGGSFVQGSSLGIKKVKDIDIRGVITTSNFNGSLKNHGFSKNKTTKEVSITSKMQVFIPWPYRESIDNYTKEITETDLAGNTKTKTVLDEDKIDARLLRLIGARIPNQGHSSMSNIEIAGFLPPSMQDLIILPDEITAQMGSDFDVDHLFTYMYNYKEMDGKLELLTEGNATSAEKKEVLQNKYVELHDTILSHPTVAQAMVAPLDMDDIVDKAKEVRKLMDAKNEGRRKIPMGREFVSAEYASAQAGKIGVAVEANASVLLTNIQDFGIEIRDEEGEKINLSIEIAGNTLQFNKLGLGHYDVTVKGETVTRSNLDTISMLLTEAVDNAKKGNLLYLGYDAVNSSVYNLLAYMTTQNNKAMPATLIASLMLQDSIGEIVTGIKKNNSMFKDKGRKEDMTTIDEVIAKYRKAGGSLTTGAVLSEELLMKAFKGEPLSYTGINGTKVDLSNADIQLMVATMYKNLFNAASDLNIANSVFKVETKGVGKDAIEILNKEAILNEVVLGSSYVDGLWKVIYKDENKNILTEIGYGIKNSVTLAKRLWASRIGGMPMNIALTSKFGELKSKLLESNANLKRNVINNHLRAMHRGFKSYVSTKHLEGSNLFVENGVKLDLAKLRVSYMLGSNKLTTRVSEYLKSDNTAGLSFLRALKLNRSADPTQPSTVELNTFKLTNYSEDAMAASWYALMKGTEFQRQLGLDLARYAILEGAAFNPLSIKKVLPTKILIDLGHGIGLNNLEIEGLDADHIFGQIVQNEPQLAADIETVASIFEEGKENQEFSVKRKEGEDSQEHPNYVSKKAGKDSYILYKRVRVGESKSFYSRIPTLNKEYSGDQSRMFSVYSPYNPDVIEVVEREISITSNNPIESIYFSKGLKGKDALLSAIEKVSSPELKAAREVLLSLRSLIPDNFQVVEDKGDFKGQVTLGSSTIPTTMAFNTANFFSSNEDTKEFKKEMEEVLLHEALHIVTGKLANAFTSNKLKGRLAPIKIQMRNIEDARKYLIASNKEAYEEYLKDRKAGKHTAAQSAKFYPLISIEEFMVAMTSSKFINYHKDTVYKNSTIGSKLKEYLIKIFDTILGGNLKPGTVLHSAFSEFLAVMDSVSNIKEDTKKEVMPIELEVIDTIKANGEIVKLLEDGSMTDDKGEIIQDIKVRNLAQVMFEYDKGRKVRLDEVALDFYVLKDGRIVLLDGDEKGSILFDGDTVMEVESREELWNKAGYQTLPPRTTEVIKASDYELFPGVFTTQEQTTGINKIKEFLSPSNKDQFFMLKGRGGTGKSTIIQKALEDARQVGYYAPTHKAKTVLKVMTGKSVSTLASGLGIKLDESTGEFKEDPYASKSMAYDSVVIIDEASMISKDILKLIKDTIDSSAKVIFMGDNVQLPPINEDKDSETFKHTKFELTKRIRQADSSPILPVTDTLADNVESGDVARIAIKDRVTEFDTEANTGVIFTKSIKVVLDLWKKDFNANPENTKIVTYNNQNHQHQLSVGNLNKRVRDLIFPNAVEDIMEGEILTAYDQFTEEGDMVLENSLDYKAIKVEKVEGISKQVAAYSKFKGGRSYNFTGLSGYNVILQNTLTQEQTPKAVFIPDKKSKLEINRVKRGMFRGGSGITRDAQMGVKIGQAFANLEYGYVVSSHKSQGSTYRNVYVMEDNILGNTGPRSNKEANQSLYVATSRASDKLVMLSSRNTEKNSFKVEDVSTNQNSHLVSIKTSKSESLSNTLNEDDFEETNCN